ncbi:uncharacterized protein PAN0_001d0673 [Moesziomyces antarcticus]|uniref:uncharacterized protein n=1 Tax=Pseudozyma antarctica TaxID=84753 RepID=UPI0007195AF4|nr:uncharacterized protein PAN0_001d0673 [Moesziomyces antarcticus]GAK62473.1 hypothetical protein PAN0_001d0673 [Moesziomyces antarcticus]
MLKQFKFQFSEPNNESRPTLHHHTAAWRRPTAANGPSLPLARLESALPPFPPVKSDATAIPGPHRLASLPLGPPAQTSPRSTLRAKLLRLDRPPLHSRAASPPPSQPGTNTGTPALLIFHSPSDLDKDLPTPRRLAPLS